MTTAVNGPFGVRLLSILIMVAGILDVVAGVFVLFQRGDDDLLAAVDVTDGDITTYGIFAIAFGVVVVLVARGLQTGANWARLLVAIIAAVRLASVIWLIVAYHHIHWYNAIWPTILYGLVAGYLFFDEDAKKFFKPA